ncbi:MAG: hypothetical protein IJ108_02045 [Eubacterium sp.]|nr:hypothetical protein [Eubacterium sp.]
MMTKIKSFLVSGFMDAGKTTYIQDTICQGFFHKRGSSLILSFEDGETAYDIEKLREFRTEVVFYQGKGSEDITAFCLSAIEAFQPDRIYIEDNILMENLQDSFPPCMHIVSKTTLIDGTTLSVYFNNMRQIMQNSVKNAGLVIFNRVPERDLLKPYGSIFPVMERNAAFLWESPMGYHEKAFGNILTFDFSANPIEIGDQDFLSFFLDITEDPDKYDGKEVNLIGQIRCEGTDSLRVGRTVMTCCMADLSFLSLACLGREKMELAGFSDHSWIRLHATCKSGFDEYRRKVTILDPISFAPARVDQQIIGFPS